MKCYELDSVKSEIPSRLNITLNVQELGGPKIWVKASNEEHRKILQRLRVHRATVPETEAAVMAAHQLTYPGMLDLIPKYGGKSCAWTPGTARPLWIST